MAGPELDDALRAKKVASSPDTSAPSSVVRPGDQASTRPDTGEEEMLAPSKMDWTGKSDDERSAYMQKWSSRPSWQKQKAASANAKRDERVKAMSDKFLEDGRNGVKGDGAGQATIDRAMSKLGRLGRAGAAVISGSKTLSDVNNSTAATVAHVGLTSLSGGNTHNLVENTSVAAELAGRTMIANDDSVQKGLAHAQEADVAASGELKSTLAGYQGKTGGVSALKAFQSVGHRVGKAAVLGGYQDLAMVKGPEEFSMDQTLGAKAPDAYKPGDTIAKDDHLQGSTYGNIKRGVKNLDWGQHGKLSDEEKASVSSIQGGLDAQAEERKKEFEARDKGSVTGAAKRLATEGDSVKLNDTEKKSREAIKSQRADAKTAADARTEQLSKEIAAARATKEARRKTKGVGDDDKDLTDMRAALAAKRTELETHTANSKSADDEFQGQIDDIHSRAKGGFTRAEVADRAAKEAEIKKIRSGATAHQEFSAKHDGKSVNRYGRVGGIEEMLNDPSKTETTTMGAIADKANSAFSELSDAGAMFGGSAENAKRLRDEGKYVKSAVTTGVGITTEATKMAGTPLPGIGHVAGLTHTALAGGIEGIGDVGQSLTADPAEEHRQKLRAKDVLDGSRRSEVAGKSWITTRKGSDSPSLGGGLAKVAASALGVKAVREGLSDVVSGGPDTPSAPTSSPTQSPSPLSPSLDSSSTSSSPAHGTSLTDSISHATQPVTHALSSAGHTVHEGLTSAGNAISDGMNTVHDSVIAPAVDGITSAGHTVAHGLSSAHDFVEDKLGSLVGDKNAEGLISDYTDAGKEALQEHVMGSLTEAGDTVGKTVSNAANSASQTLSGPVATANSVLHPTSPTSAQVQLGKTIAKRDIAPIVSGTKPVGGVTAETTPQAPQKSSWWSRMTGWMGRKVKQAGHAIKSFGSRVRGWFGG